MARKKYKIFGWIFLLLPVKTRLRVIYFIRYRRFLTYNRPVYFSEKIQVKKIRDRHPLLSVTADKLEVKEYVAKLCPDVGVAKVLWTASCVNEVKNFTSVSLPQTYVIKSNYGSQDVIIVRDGRKPSADVLLKKYALSSSIWKRGVGGVYGEWAYKSIPRKIFVEDFIGDGEKVPEDYKFFVYHGRVHFVQVDHGRFSDHRRNMLDRDWRDLGFEYSHPRRDPPPPRPEKLTDMIAVAEVLAKPFDFVRVDLYLVRGKIYFGEFTHYPGGGFEVFPNDDWDYKFGQPWII